MTTFSALEADIEKARPVKSYLAGCPISGGSCDLICFTAIRRQEMKPSVEMPNGTIKAGHHHGKRARSLLLNRLAFGFIGGFENELPDILECL